MVHGLTCETWIEESKNQMALGQIKMDDFWGSSAIFQCSILAYNTIRWMALCSGDKQLCRWEPATIMRFLIRVAGKLRKGSKNKNHREVVLNAEMTQVLSMLQNLLKLTEKTFQKIYFVYDGAFGNNAAVQITRKIGSHLISKLRNNPALYFEWDSVYSGKGRRPIYGDRVNYSNFIRNLSEKDAARVSS